MEVSRLLSGLCFVVLRISLAVACQGTEGLVTHESVTYVIGSLEFPCSPLVLWSTVLEWRIASSQPHRKGGPCSHPPIVEHYYSKMCHGLFQYLLHIAVSPIQQLTENLEELLLFWIWLPDVRIDENCIRNVTTQNGMFSQVIG